MKRILYVSIAGLLSIANCAFYDCPKELNGLKSDQEALTKVKAAH